MESSDSDASVLGSGLDAQHFTHLHGQPRNMGKRDLAESCSVGARTLMLRSIQAHIALACMGLVFDRG